jgi:hypothetical protein
MERNREMEERMANLALRFSATTPLYDIQKAKKIGLPQT